MPKPLGCFVVRIEDRGGIRLKNWRNLSPTFGRSACETCEPLEAGFFLSHDAVQLNDPIHFMRHLTPSLAVAAFTAASLFLTVPPVRAASPAPSPVATASVLAAKAYTGKGLRPAQLRCEYLVNPLGIGETQPRLRWIAESGLRGQKQTAYRVVVASSEALLKKETGDLWDSGKVASDETTAIVYAGKPLGSRQRCFWQAIRW